MTWMVTGGAGYIGSHIVRAFQSVGVDVVVFDDLSSGFEDFIPAHVPFVHASILDRAQVDKALVEYRVTGILHLAGFKYAGVSVNRPLHCYEQNVEGTRVLLEAGLEQSVDRFLFSSSAATYGTPDVDLVTEATPTSPESPYGESKLIGEWLLADVRRANPTFRSTALRYFNVVGSGFPDLFDASPHNLFPLVIKAIDEGRTPKVFGDDYATPDGSCVRDYVHVMDVAEAHVVAAMALDAGKPTSPVYNIGVGEGTSVLQIMAAFSRVLGREIAYEIAPRRPGDPARIVATSELLTSELGWVGRFSLDDMVRSAWDSRPALN